MKWISRNFVLQSEGEDELKKRQLMELAIINGTYRDSSSKNSSRKYFSLLLWSPAAEFSGRTKYFWVVRFVNVCMWHDGQQRAEHHQHTIDLLGWHIHSAANFKTTQPFITLSKRFNIIFIFSWSGHHTKTSDRQQFSSFCCPPGPGPGPAWRQSWRSSLDIVAPAAADPHHHHHGRGHPQRRPPAPHLRRPDPAAAVRPVRDCRLWQLCQPHITTAGRLSSTRGCCWWVIRSINIKSPLFTL